jgi:hypothetical protein
LGASVLVLGLAACGQGGAGRLSGAASDACAMLGDPAPLFGADADVAGYRGIDQMAASCEFSAADGARAGEIVTYTAASLVGASPESKMQEFLQKWASQTATPLASVAGIEGAQLATDLPGYQSQVAFVKHNVLVLIQAHTGDANTAPGADLARRMAARAAASTQDPRQAASARQ